ncbi:hypothetical protein KFK09_023410 [Dendrobium nobile]|uniref:Protein kinase domain-containing protein n=1 Tax=Dendrobium nobile TaxID=94219 RepID=A0A8T3AMR3_DENNO|nr:hypothetical protein KFK09_023410 [Dendrobium nobile]
MAQYLIALIAAIVFILVHLVISITGETDSPDVSALTVMYKSLNSPSQLTGWKSSGGDPCGKSWKGISCSGSSVTEINLSGLGLTGTLGYQLSSLASVTYFDLSRNNLHGDIPYQLPPSAVHINLAGNTFTGRVPYSISEMSDLETLILANNQLSGQASDMFGKLRKLYELDLSFNRFSGNLPQSFGSLKLLKTLYLQNNQFTGSVNVLASLHLDNLNIQNNQFTGWIPDGFKKIGNLQAGGNSWSSSRAPPHYHIYNNDNDDRSSGAVGKKSSVINGLAIGGAVVAVLFIIVFLLALMKKKSATSLHYIDESDSQRRSFALLVSHDKGTILLTLVLAVKKVDSPSLDFVEVISGISRLHHPNISELVGFCSESGFNLLVYEYERNGSLHDYLHLSDDYCNPLTWDTRVRIALGTARYQPPEYNKPSDYTMKSDVYCFGVVMLELLTGRKPFDSQRPEQSLVRWAMPQLHDIGALAQMVDPALRGLYSPKSLSRFADVIALCVQPEPEFRPPISEVVQALVLCVRRSSISKKIGGELSTSRRSNESDYYY